MPLSHPPILDLAPMKDIVTAHLMRAIRLTNGNQARAAAALGMTVWAFRRWCRRYGVQLGGLK